MIDDSDLLLARMAVNFGHATADQMEGLVKEAGEAGKPLASFLVEKGVCSEAQLKLILTIHGADMGELVVQEKQERELVSRTLYCPYHEQPVEIEAYDENEKYQCQQCGSLLVTEKPRKPQRAAIKAAPKPATLLVCPICDAEQEVEGWEPGKLVRCPDCEAVMVPDDAFDAGNDTDEMPALQEMDITGEITTKTVSAERQERQANERRSSLMIARAKAMIKAGDAEGALRDLQPLIASNEASADALILHSRTALRLGKLDAGESSASVLSKLRGHAADGYALQGYAHWLRESVRKASAVLDMALEDNPSHILALLLRGACHHKNRAMTQARQDLEAAVKAAEGVEEQQPEDVQLMLRQAFDFIQTGKLENFGLSEADAEAGMSTEVRHKNAAAKHEALGELYLSAREYRLAGNADKALELYAAVLDADAVDPQLVEAAKEQGFADPKDYRAMVCNEALATLKQDAHQHSESARHKMAAAEATQRAGVATDRGADAALEAAAIWAQLGNPSEEDACHSLAADLMGWPCLILRAWTETTPRESNNCTLRIQLTNEGKGQARAVRIQHGEYLRFERELRIGDVDPGQTIQKDIQFRPTRRGAELISELKMYYRDAASDRQLTRTYAFAFEVIAAYEGERLDTFYWIGEPHPDSPSPLEATPSAPSAGRDTGPVAVRRPGNTGAISKREPEGGVAAAADVTSLEERMTALETKLDRVLALLEQKA